MRLVSSRDLLHRRIVLIPLALVVVALAVRAVLPMLVTRYLNQEINSVKNLAGHIQDVDLRLWRGAYTVHGLALYQVIGQRQEPVLTVPRADFSIEWRALMSGAVVGDMTLFGPRLNIIAGAEKKQAQSTDILVDRVRALLPLRINRFELVDAELHFFEPKASPDVDIYLDQIHLVARNLTNSEKISESMAATVTAEGRAMRSGQFTLDMKLNPLEKTPTYKLAFELKDLRLPELNSFLRHYLSVEARDGWFTMSAESAAKGGKFTGYVKPMTRDLDILKVETENKSAVEIVKGFFVKLIADIFTNEPKDQIATKVEFSGTFKNPEVSVWEAVSEFMRNAFVRALEPGLEGSVAPAQAERAGSMSHEKEKKGSTQPKR